MSTGAAIPRGAPAPGTLRARGGVGSVFRTERRKLTSQLAIRLLALACAIAPFAFAAVLKAQGGAPSDALFGIWVHSSGLAISLVVLGFAGSWGFPLMAGVLAGDVFSSEDPTARGRRSPRARAPAARCSSGSWRRRWPSPPAWCP